MVQLQRMDAHLDTLSTELYQVNICVSRIARRQAVMGGFVSETSPPPTLEASEAEVNDHNATASEDDDDGDAHSSGQMRCLLDTLALRHS